MIPGPGADGRGPGLRGAAKMAVVAFAAAATLVLIIGLVSLL